MCMIMWQMLHISYVLKIFYLFRHVTNFLGHLFFFLIYQIIGLFILIFVFFLKWFGNGFHYWQLDHLYETVTDVTLTLSNNSFFILNTSVFFHFSFFFFHFIQCHAPMSIVQSLLLLNALIQQLPYDRRNNDIDNKEKIASKLYFI